MSIAYDPAKFDEARTAYLAAVDATRAHEDRCPQCDIGRTCSRLAECYQVETDTKRLVDEYAAAYDAYVLSLPAEEQNEIKRQQAIQLQSFVAQGLISEKQIAAIRNHE